MGVWELVDVARGWAGMSRAELVATSGAALGFLGGVVLAFAASDELTAHRLAISALQLEVQGLLEAQSSATSPLYKVGGVDKHMGQGVRSNTARTWFGIGCLVASLVLTVGSFFAKDPPRTMPEAAKVVAPGTPPPTGHGGAQGPS
jgi:hypothetical protein